MHRVVVAARERHARTQQHGAVHADQVQALRPAPEHRAARVAGTEHTGLALRVRVQEAAVLILLALGARQLGRVAHHQLDRGD